MLKSKPVLVLMTAVVLLATAVASTFAADAPKAAGEFKLGVVDIDRVRQEYTEVKSASAQVEGMKASLDSLLNERQRNKLLSLPELEELIKLVQMEKPTDKDKQRVLDLEKRGSELAAELDGLRAKNPLSDGEKARLAELTGIETKNTSEIESVRAKYYVDVQNKNDELVSKLTEKMNAEIAKIAQEKGIAAVIGKNLVIFGGTDITDELLTRLNKK